METPVRKQDLDSLRFSVYDAVSDTVGRVADWEQITSRFLTSADAGQKDAISRLRAEYRANGHSERYNEIKRKELNVWCPAGVLHREKGNSRVIEWSGIVQLDIDQSDNAGEDIRQVLDDFVFKPASEPIRPTDDFGRYVLASSLSCGGTGCFLLFRCPVHNEEDYTIYVRALCARLYFQTGLIADYHTCEPNRLRFLTIDDAQIINPDAWLFELDAKMWFVFKDSGTDAQKSRNKPVADNTATEDVWAVNLSDIKFFPAYRRGWPRMKRALKDIGRRRVDIAPSAKDFETLIVSLKSAASSGVFSQYDGLRILFFVCQFWGNPNGETWQQRAEVIRSRWKSYTGVVKPYGFGLFCFNGFYGLYKRYALENQCVS